MPSWYHSLFLVFFWQTRGPHCHPRREKLFGCGRCATGCSYSLLRGGHHSQCHNVLGWVDVFILIWLSNRDYASQLFNSLWKGSKPFSQKQWWWMTIWSKSKYPPSRPVTCIHFDVPRSGFKSVLPSKHFLVFQNSFPLPQESFILLWVVHNSKKEKPTKNPLCFTIVIGLRQQVYTLYIQKAESTKIVSKC